MGIKVLGLIAILASTARSSQAQSSPDTMPPVLLIHGFTSDSTTWAATVGYLNQVAGFTRLRRTTTPYLQNLDYQLGVLNTYSINTGLNAQSPILAAHSMGGLLARKLSRGFPVDAIITIGTPHLGHPLIANASRPATILGVGSFVTGLAYDIYNLLSKCNQFRYDVDGNPREGPCYNIWGPVLAALSVSGFVYLAEEKLINGHSIGDMDPNSSWISDLNSANGRAQEWTSRKISLVGQLMPWEGGVSFYRNLFAEYWAPGVANYIDFQGYLLTALSIDMFSELQWDDPWFFEKSIGALSVGQAGLFMANVPLWWNGLLGGWPNDGFIPIARQTYPGAVHIDAFGLAHGEETESWDIKLKIAEIGRALVRH